MPVFKNIAYISTFLHSFYFKSRIPLCLLNSLLYLILINMYFKCLQIMTINSWFNLGVVIYWIHKFSWIYLLPIANIESTNISWIQYNSKLRGSLFDITYLHVIVNMKTADRNIIIFLCFGSLFLQVSAFFDGMLNCCNTSFIYLTTSIAFLCKF